jgi:plastocyanin
MKTVVLFLALAFAAPAAAATTTVKVADNYFVRDGGVSTVKVRRGDVVVWRFVGRNPHSVVVKRGPERFRTGPRTSSSYTRRMKETGDYTIYCGVHGASMQMRLVVKR